VKTDQPAAISATPGCPAPPRRAVSPQHRQAQSTVSTAGGGPRVPPARRLPLM